MNNSTTGGYIKPSSTQGFPRNLTLTQFLQTVFVGLTGIDGTLVRPKWQPEPLKQPDLTVNWMAYGVTATTPDANAYLGVNDDGLSSTMQRHALLEVQCSFYGPQAQEYADLVRDGFQIPQNRSALKSANMGFVEVGPAQHIPDLVNERFINRVEMGVFLRRETIRTYPILTLLSADGIIYINNAGDDTTTLTWLTTS